MMSPPTQVNPSGPAKNLRPRAHSTLPNPGGVNPTDPSSAAAPPPQIPRDGATTHTPDHRMQPQASTTEESLFHTVTGRNTTPMHLATITHSVKPPLQNAFEDLVRADEDSTAADGAPNEDDDKLGISVATAREDGNSQPLINEIMLLDVPMVDDAPIIAENTIVAALAAHDRAIMLALADVAGVITTTTNYPSTTAPATTDTAPEPTMALIMFMLHTMQTTNQAILACLDTIDATSKMQHG
jgi:hypothetical protein